MCKAAEFLRWQAERLVTGLEMVGFVDLVATDADADADRGVMWIGRRRERTPGNGC